MMTEYNDLAVVVKKEDADRLYYMFVGTGYSDEFLKVTDTCYIACHQSRKILVGVLWMWAKFDYELIEVPSKKRLRFVYDMKKNN